MLGHTFVQFIDNVMVGQLGTAELAAISLGNSFIFIAMSVGIGFSTAITPLVAEGDAAKRPEEVKSIFYHGLLWCLVLGLVLFLSVYLSRNMMFSMGQPEEVAATVAFLVSDGAAYISGETIHVNGGMYMG